LIYICIPAHNEEQTVGVVLWKIRQVMAEYPRDYQLLVVDDASTDRTPDVLAPYARVLPLTVVRTESKHGEGAAIEMMLREAVRRSEYPKRDMIITLQADFTQEPDELVGLIKRMEAGADIVVGETRPGPQVSPWVRWAKALALRVLGKARIPEGVKDPFTSYRAYRVAAVKAALAGRNGGRLVHWGGWAGAAELLLATAPNARRIDTVELIERRERLQRPSRLQPWAALRAVWSLAREARPLQVTSPADLDQAMQAIAAVRTSEVSARSERTQRQERARGTSEERRPREGAKRREPTGRTGSAPRGERPERGERQDRTGRPASGAPKPRREGAAPAGVERGTPAAGSEGRKPAPPVAAVAAGGVAGEAGVVDAAASAERPKRKRPRRRKRTGAGNGAVEASAAANGAASEPVPPDVGGEVDEAASAASPNGGDSPAATAVFPDGAETPSPAASRGAVGGEDAEAGAAVERPAARRRRRGRRGGRRRSNANGAQSEGDGPGGGEAAAGGEAGGEAPEQIGIFELIEGERTHDT